MSDAPVMKLGKVLDQLLDEILKLRSSSIAEVRELKADLCFRSNGSHLSAHMEGHLVDGEKQFYDLVHDER